MDALSHELLQQRRQHHPAWRLLAADNAPLVLGFLAEAYLLPKSEPKKRAQAGFGAATVKKHYKGGISEYWRPFLEELADHSGEWREWETLCEAIGLTPRQASGMLGAAERRCKLLPPYEKAYEDGKYWFRMPEAVAEVVKGLAAA